MRGVIRITQSKAIIYTELSEDGISDRISITSYLELRLDHDLREKAVLKFIENAKIVDFSKVHKQDIEIEFENGDKLKKLENILKVKLVNREVKSVLKDYIEGEITLEDAHLNLLHYVIAGKLIKT